MNNQPENPKEDHNYQIARNAVRTAQIEAQKAVLVAMSFIVAEEQTKLETAHLKPVTNESK